MAKRRPAEVIESYRQSQGHKTLFSFANISQAFLLLIILVASMYIAITGRPTFPTLVELKTNTPTFTPSITPTPSSTATFTFTPTETLDPENQCDCPAAATVIVIITATFSDTNTPMPLPTATTISSPTLTLIPSDTPTPTKTRTSTPSASPTPTQIIYIVKIGDTLSGIALKFNVTVEAIQALNNMDTTIIYVGQVLQIPQP